MNELADKINADKEFTMEAYRYIKSELDKETAKPLHKRDFDRIEQLTAQLAELSGDKPSDNTDSLYRQIREYERTAKKPLNIFKRFVPVLCCFVLVITANCVSVAAWNMNIISAVIKFTQGGFSVDFGNQPEEVVLPTSEDDPYGFIAKLAEYDIEFETPHYIPDGFVLTDVDTNVNENFSSSVSFHYENDKQKFILSYDKYLKAVPDIVIPSDEYNLSETEVNGSTAIISKEDNQYTITYQNGKTNFVMFAVDVPYDECDKMVASIK